MTQIKGTASPEMAEEEDEEREEDEEEEDEEEGTMRKDVEGKWKRKVGGRIVDNAWVLKKWWRKLIMNKLTTKRGWGKGRKARIERGKGGWIRRGKGERERE